MRFVVVLLLLAAPVLNAGCKPSLIPGTNIEDTDENRKVIEFLAKYRTAILSRNPDQVVGLCTKDYFEDNGTPDQADDYGIDGLKTKLQNDFAKTKDIELELIVQKIERPENEKGTVNVAYRYNERALVNLPSGERWFSISDVNRLVLKQNDNSYLIQSGL
jgi:hypothetical protein